MKKSPIKLSVLSSTFLLLGVSLSGCSTPASVDSSQVDPKTLPVVFNHASFSVDVNDPRATAGDADYVFVAQVDSIDGITYKNPVTIETDDGSKEVSDPYTNFHVTVIDNLKGELETSVSIPVQKAGGVTEDASMVVLYEDDLLPEVGSTYVLLAYTQTDGSLLISGPNSSPEVDEVENGAEIPEVTKDLRDAEIVDTYELAVDKQLDTNREQIASVFDVSSK